MVSRVEVATPTLRRWLRRAGVLLAALAALWVVLWLAVPPIVRSQAEQRLGALLGREVRIGEVAFAPWSLALTVRDLRVAPAGGGDGPPQFAFARLFVDASLSSLFRRAPVLEALELDEPVLRLTRRADGSLDIDDIAARLKPAPDAPASTEPARFALYNLQLRGGVIQVDDQLAKQTHSMKSLLVGLPFLSNLPAHIAVKVEPRVAFDLDGSRFDTGAQVVPFAERRGGTARLQVQALDLSRWAPYVPASVPLRLRQGRLDTDLTADFAFDAAGAPTLALRGRVAVADLALTAAGAAPGDVLGWQRLEVALDDVRPLQRHVALGEVVLDGARLDLRRDADGRLALQRVLAAAAPARPAATASASSSAPAPAAAEAAWSVALQRLRVAGAALAWQDAAVQPASALRLEAVDAEWGPFRSDDAAPAPLRWSARLAADGSPPATLAGEGRAGPNALDLGFDVKALAFAPFAPYLAPFLVPRLDGRLSVQGRFEQAGGDAPRQLLTLSQLRVDELRLRGGDARQPPVLAQWQALELADARIDLRARRVALGRLALRQPQLDVARGADGRLNVLDWLPPSAAGAPSAAAAAPAEAPWQLQLRELQLDDGRIGWRDAGAATGPVAVQAAALRVGLQNLQWPAAARTPPAGLTLSTQLADLRPARRPGPPGRIEWRGQVGLEPLLARGELRIERLPVHAFAPYVPTQLQLVLAHADAGWRGRVAVQQSAAGLDVAADGDALLSTVHVHAREADGSVGDELLNWQRLALDGLRLRIAPGGAPDVQVREAALTDFYSRLVITEQGRFNLRDIAAASPAGAAASAPAAPAEPASAPAAAASAPAFALAIGSTKLANGRIDFTDRFVRPNYSAALSGLEGSLGAFRTGSTEMAPLTLTGRVAGTGVLEIAGTLNPMARPLALDIRAKASEIELSPLSPYAARYAGYGIERGKLGMEVAYKIEPDGRLDARNRVVLNQLTFGDRVDSPDATKLPVALAIALLKDRHGVIDLDLPVSGSLNDPQFSVFGIVLKLLGNLLVKAVTAPFSLLFGGGGADDGGLVAFQPGTDRLTPAGVAAVDKVAKALAERPGLSLTLTGSADAASEREAIRGALLDARLAAERRRTAGEDAPPPTAAERDALLKRLYDDTKLPDKPRNFVGLAKSLPPVEMEVRLRAAIPVTDETVRELAQRRSTEVRDALLAKGLASDRLFIAAPRLAASAPEAAASEASAVAGSVAAPGVRLELATH